MFKSAPSRDAVFQVVAWESKKLQVWAALTMGHKPIWSRVGHKPIWNHVGHKPIWSCVIKCRNNTVGNGKKFLDAQEPKINSKSAWGAWQCSPFTVSPDICSFGSWHTVCAHHTVCAIKPGVTSQRSLRLRPASQDCLYYLQGFYCTHRVLCSRGNNDLITENKDNIFLPEFLSIALLQYIFGANCIRMFDITYLSWIKKYCIVNSGLRLG